jgi:zinc/manganese transport system ATP-binding protein
MMITMTGAPALPQNERAAISLRGAELSYGRRLLWRELDLEVRSGEFLAVLGPNGSGKTSLLKVLLGQQELSAGTAVIGGGKPGTTNDRIGYIPQQRPFEPGIPLRGRDLVGLGLDGHRWGGWLGGRRERRQRVQAALDAVGADGFADGSVGLLSGGEQQRLRVAQALVSDPEVLLCDEPLLSLDIAHQAIVSELIDRRRREHRTAVLFVTHEINPVLPLVDRVLYLVNGKFRVGTPEQVMTRETLSELYGTPVEVLRTRDQIFVVGTNGALGAEQHHMAEPQFGEGA